MFNKIKSYFQRNSPYDAANPSRNRKNLFLFQKQFGDEDKAVESTISDLRKECRNLYRNNYIVKSAVNRYTLYSIGTGIIPRPQTSDKNWNKLVEKWWTNIYTPNADYRGMQGVDLVELQKLIISHRLLDGDCGIALLDNGQILPIEAERITTPIKYKDAKSVVNGVRLDRNGIVMGYYVCDRVANTIDKNSYTYYAKKDFILCAKTDRFDQIRGIPDIATAINKIKDLEETDEYIRAKIKLDSLQAYKVIGENADSFANSGQRGMKNIKNSDGTIQKIDNVGGLTMHYLPEGTDIQSMGSVTPNQTYMPFVIQQIKDVSACLGISYEILLLEFTNGSYSSQRQALLHNQTAFYDITKWLTKTVLSKIYNWRIALAIKNKEIPASPVDENGMPEFYKKTFSQPYKEWVDPQSQATADQMKWNMGVESLKNILESQGKDRDEVLSEKAQDIKQAILVANELNSQDLSNEKITWRDIILTTQPGQVVKSPEDNIDKTPSVDETEEEKDDLE